MANIEFRGIDEIEMALKGVIDGVEEFNMELAHEGASIAKKQIEKSIIQHGHVRTGTLLHSIKIFEKRGKDGHRYVEVIGSGSHPGLKKKYAGNAYVAFALNYGNSRMAGSRFWTIAEEYTKREYEEVANQKTNLFFKQKGLK